YELNSGSLPSFFIFSTPDEETAYFKLSVQNAIAQGIPPHEIAILAHDYSSLWRWDNLQNSGVYVAGFQRMKGLEFRMVYLPSLNTLFQTVMDDEELAEIRRKLFTAMTRAKQYLILSAIESIPEPIKPILEFVTIQNVNDG
ncbi:MAG TPA: ATP-binding domain-containing protein, partial [Aggregatilineales bacterium]|nr:ATP-binding domain-containing protein [Aggregatilineales bacterium]